MNSLSPNFTTKRHRTDKRHTDAISLATRFPALRELCKSILTAKTTFVAQEAALRAALRTTPYKAAEEAEADGQAEEEVAEVAPCHLLMHRFQICNMLGDHKTIKKPGICTGSALHFEMLFELSRGLFDLSSVPCSYENGEYAAMAVCTAFGRAKLHGGERRFDLLQMVSRDVATLVDLKAGGLPHHAYSGANHTKGMFDLPWSLKSGQSVFLVKCMDQGVHVGSFIYGVITHPGHDEAAPTEAQTAMRAQLIHNLLVGRVTRAETLYLHKEDIDAVFTQHGRTVAT